MKGKNAMSKNRKTENHTAPVAAPAPAPVTPISSIFHPIDLEAVTKATNAKLIEIIAARQRYQDQRKAKRKAIETERRNATLYARNKREVQ